MITNTGTISQSKTLQPNELRYIYESYDAMRSLLDIGQNDLAIETLKRLRDTISKRLEVLEYK